DSDESLGLFIRVELINTLVLQVFHEFFVRITLCEIYTHQVSKLIHVAFRQWERDHTLLDESFIQGQVFRRLSAGCLLLYTSGEGDSRGHSNSQKDFTHDTLLS